MKVAIFGLFLVLFSINSFAEKLKDLEITSVFKNGAFVVSKDFLKAGDKIFIVLKGEKKAAAVGIVVKCKKTSCLVRPKKWRKGFKVSSDSRALAAVEQVEIEVKKKNASEKSSEGSDSKKNWGAFAGAGGPLSYGVRGKLRYWFENGFQIGVTGSRFGFSWGGVKVSASGAGLESLYEVFKLGRFTFLALGELGFLGGSLDFSGVDSEGEEVAASAPYYMTGAEVQYFITSNLGIAGSAQYSQTLFDSYYVNQAGKKYYPSLNTPFITADIGMIYKF